MAFVSVRRMPLISLRFALFSNSPNLQSSFCARHRRHECAHAPAASDGQVPVCPLCEDPVALARPGEDFNIAVSRHIAEECGKSPAKNKCLVRRCKESVLLLSCGGCAGLVCPRHRIAHSCASGDAFCRPQASIKDARKAALARRGLIVK